jgi:hypothetical protein
MDITLLERNQERIRVSGGINPLTGKLLVEGPVKKTKGTFAVGDRTTYSDWILGLLPDIQLQIRSAVFYDLHGHIKRSTEAIIFLQLMTGYMISKWF